MSSYCVMGEFQNTAPEIGKSMAIHFDYGQVHHDKYGDANLAGTILCFGTYKVFQKSSIPRENNSEAEKIGLAMMDNLYSLGVPEVIFEKSMTNRVWYVQSIEEDLELFAWSYPDMDIQEAKIQLCAAVTLDHMEEAIDVTREKGEDYNCLIQLFKLVLSGKLTHLDQLEVPDWLKTSVGFMILLRREVLASKVPRGWEFMTDAILSFLWASSKEEGVEDYSILQYMNLRSRTSFGLTFVEADLITHGIWLSEDVRNDPDFQNIKFLISLYAGLMNDVVGLQKEINGGEMHNVVILLAQTMSLQDAIQEALRIMENTYFEVRAAARGLLQSFPNDTSIDHIVSTTTRCAELGLLAQEIAVNRYGLSQSSKFLEIRFNDEFMRKERKIQEFKIAAVDRKNFGQDSALAIAISKLDRDCKLDNGCGYKVVDQSPVISVVQIQRENENYVKDAGDTPIVKQLEALSDVIGQVEKELVLDPSEIEIMEGFSNFGDELALSVPWHHLKDNCDKLAESGCRIKHLAIIPDGNRRWARKQGVTTISGHYRGGDSLGKLVQRAFERGIHTVTAWGLSPENFNRSKEELENLFTLFEQRVRKFEADALETKVRIHHVGNRSRLPERILKVTEEVEEKTKHFTERTLNIGLDYGGRDDILRACSKIQGPPTSDAITANLWTCDQPYPEPDLIVRTGCKDSDTVRTSGFMIWQSVYSEFYFEDKYMPEVCLEDLDKWIDAFNKADRRFGK